MTTRGPYPIGPEPLLLAAAHLPRGSSAARRDKSCCGAYINIRIRSLLCAASFLLSSHLTQRGVPCWTGMAACCAERSTPHSQGHLLGPAPRLRRGRVDQDDHRRRAARRRRARSYTALHRLEKNGLLTAEWGYSENNRRAKYYQLSRAADMSCAPKCLRAGNDTSRRRQSVGCRISDRPPEPSAIVCAKSFVFRLPARNRARRRRRARVSLEAGTKRLIAAGWVARRGTAGSPAPVRRRREVRKHASSWTNSESERCVEPIRRGVRQDIMYALSNTAAEHRLHDRRRVHTRTRDRRQHGHFHAHRRRAGPAAASEAPGATRRDRQSRHRVTLRGQPARGPVLLSPI